MDYTSFAPGNKSAKPNYNLPELPPPHKPFTHKFLGTLCIVIAVAGAIAYGIWIWGNYISPAAIAPSPSPSVSADPTVGWQTYTNTKYGFSIALPSDWTGYTVLSNEWEGYIPNTSTGDRVIDHGPLMVLRNPKWTSANKTEDMPIMVFTPTQWGKVQKEQMNIGAAPFPPSLLAQNSEYILALPARYNYDFSNGWQEVDQLVHALKAFEPAK